MPDILPVYADDELDELTKLDTAWNKNEWIGCGRSNKDVPYNIAKHRDKLLQIPAEFQPLIPPDNLSVLQLVAMRSTLPQQDEITPVTTQDLDWDYDQYETRNLQEDIPCIMVPSLEALTRLDESFGQAWLDGKRSLLDRRTGLSRFYPPWILSYFFKLRLACRIARKWNDALEWLEEESIIEDEEDAKNTVRMLLRTTQAWHGPLPGLEEVVHLELVADILGDKPLATSVIDAMVSNLSLQLHHTYPDSPILFATTTFPDYIVANAWINDTGRTKYLEKCSASLKNKKHTSLFFVFHVPPFHWAACTINFKTCRIQYGDSLRLARNKTLFDGIIIWLKHEFKDMNFTISDDLPCATQNDSFNCPIISVNTLEHAAFGEPLWTERTSRLKRMQAFCDILNSSTHRLAKVSTTLTWVWY